MKFKNFIGELLTKFREKRKYISVVYDDKTQAKLINWATENGFDLTKTYSGKDQSVYDFIFHTTLFHSETKHDIDNEEYNDFDFIVTPVKFEFLGENQDIPVLKIESPDLIELRKIFQDEFDMKDKWPSYKPHISLSYSKGAPVIENLKLPNFDLRVNVLRIMNVED